MTSQKPALQILPALTQEQEQKVSDLLLAVSPVLEVNTQIAASGSAGVVALRKNIVDHTFETKSRTVRLEIRVQAGVLACDLHSTETRALSMKQPLVYCRPKDCMLRIRSAVAALLSVTAEHFSFINNTIYAGKSAFEVLVHKQHFGQILASKRLELNTSREAVERHFRMVCHYLKPEKPSCATACEDILWSFILIVLNRSHGSTLFCLHVTSTGTAAVSWNSFSHHLSS